jgi:hypothetical protein
VVSGMHAVTAPTGVLVNRNDFSGVNGYGIVNDHSTGSLDGTCNWWGSASTGASATQVPGPRVTKAPWLLTSNLNDPNNCWGGSASLPVIDVTPVTTPEGNSGAHVVSVSVTLNHGSSNPVTVTFQTIAATAKPANNDYTTTSGVLTFNPGETAKTVDVTVNGDLTPENFETFKVSVKNPSNATLAGGGTTRAAVVTLLNDDVPKLTAAVTNVYVNEGSDAVVQYKINFPYYQDITVDVSSADGTAKAPGDYVPVPAGTTVVFHAGSKVSVPTTISVHANTDGVLAEPQEKLTVTGHPETAGMTNKVVTILIRANST